MDWIACPLPLCVFRNLLLACYAILFGQVTFADDSISSPKIDPVALQEHATRALDTYCVNCHGPEKQKGDLRFDALETIDPVDLQDLYANMQEVIQL